MQALNQSLQDPFVRLTAYQQSDNKNQIQKETAHKENAGGNCTFNQTLIVPCRPGMDALFVDLYDHNSVTGHELLGRAALSFTVLAQQRDHGIHHFWNFAFDGHHQIGGCR